MAIPPASAIRARAVVIAQTWGYLALVAFCYLYVVPYYPGIRSANELPRAYLVKAIADHRTFAIDDGVRRWGATADVSPWGGRSYSNKAPGSSLAAVPAYLAWRTITGREPTLGETVWIGRLVTGILPTLILLALLPGFLVSRGASPKVARLTVTVYALGSMAMPYSVLFIAHQPSAVVVMLAWMLAARARTAGAMLAAGVLAGSGPLLDYQAALALIPLSLLLIAETWRAAGRWRLWIAGLVGAALPIALLLAYHDAAFGSPWRTGYAASETFAVYHQQGFLGLAGFRWEALIGSLFTADNGLLVFSPFWILAGLGLRRLWRAGRKAEALALGATAIGYVWFLSSLTFWRGGWQLGPRYITVMLPLLLVPLSLELDAWLARPVSSVAAIAGCIFAVAVYAGSCAQFPHFPERFPNPVIELTWRLWVEGSFAPNPLGAMGLGGPWCLAPYAAAVIAAMTSALAACVSRRRALVGLGVACAAFVALGFVPHGHPANEPAYQWVRGVMAERQGL